MRIISILLLATLLILGFLFLEQNIIHQVKPAVFLPADTLVYVEQQDGARFMRQFRDSRLGKTLAAIDFLQIFKQIGTDQATLGIMENTLNRLHELKKNRLVNELLGKQCSLALFAPRKWSKKFTTFSSYLKEHLLLISKPKVSTGALDMLLAYYGGGVKITAVPYGGYSIKRIHLKNNTISAVFTDGYILASLEERILREALDTRDKEKGGALSAERPFSQFSKNLAGADRFIYFSIDGLRRLANAAGLFPATPGKEEADPFTSLNGFTTAAYGAWQDETLSWDRMLIDLDKMKMDPPIKKMLSISPEANTTLPFAGADSLLYYWTNTMNFNDLWEMYLERAGADASQQRDIVELRQAVHDFSGGYQPEEITHMLGNTLCILLHQSKRSQFIRLPDLALLIKLKEPKKVAAILKHMRTKLNITVQSRRYHHVEYHSWGLYSRENLQPVYAIYKNYLILANTMDIFQKIITSSKGKKELLDSVDFAAIDPGFRKENNSVCYVDQAALAGTLQELASWAGTLIAIQDRQTAAKSKILIDRLINPLLSGLAMYDKMATRTYIEDNRIIIETHTEINN